MPNHEVSIEVTPDLVMELTIPGKPVLRIQITMPVAVTLADKLLTIATEKNNKVLKAKQN